MIEKGGTVRFRIAICDDMPECSDELKNLILKWGRCPEDLSIDAFSDGDTLINAHTEKPYDTLFPDVVIPLHGGIEAVAEIHQQDKSVQIVFLTVSAKYAVDSYRFKASSLWI